MLSKENLTRLFSVIGRLAGAGSCVFVLWVLWDQRELILDGLEYEGFWLAFSASVALWIGVNVCLGLGWSELVWLLGGRIRTMDSVELSFRTQIAKYLPGNVFHLVGRAVQAKRFGVELTQGSLAVGLESVFLLLVAGVLGTSVVVQLFGFWWIYIAGALFLALGASLAYRGKLGSFVSLRSLERDRLWRALPLASAAYLCVFLLQALMFASVAGVIGFEAESFFRVLEMVSVAWGAGFAVIGAPGGIGVREAAYSLFSSGKDELASLLLIASVMRVASIAGDLACFLVGTRCFRKGVRIDG